MNPRSRIAFGLMYKDVLEILPLLSTWLWSLILPDPNLSRSWPIEGFLVAVFCVQLNRLVTHLLVVHPGKGYIIVILVLAHLIYGGCQVTLGIGVESQVQMT